MLGADKDEHSPLRMYWEVPSRLQDVEVLLRERLSGESVVRPVFELLGHGGSGRVFLELCEG